MVVAECGQTLTTTDHSLATVEGKDVITYGTHHLNLTATDSEGTKKASVYNFIVYEFNVPNVTIILRYPWLYTIDPVIEFKKGTWRYPFEQSQISTLSAKKFAKEYRYKTIYYIIIKSTQSSE